MRVFLDTNVLVSAFATRGLCAELFESILLEHELITGDAVIAELTRTLRGKLKLPAARCNDITLYVRDVAASHIRGALPVDARVDPGDAVVLGEALAGAADVFVTGDGEVQQLTALDQMRILSPREFWTLLHSGTQVSNG